MSARGWLLTNPGSSRSAIISESASYIPLFWLSFLSLDDLKNAKVNGQFKLDRKRAVELSSSRLQFFASLFPKRRTFRTTADSLIQQVASLKSKTIGIEFTELFPNDPDSQRPSFEATLGAIERQDANFSYTIPSRIIMNPFTRKKERYPERRFHTTGETLLQFCLIEPEFLTSKSKDYVREMIIGYVWK